MSVENKARNLCKNCGHEIKKHNAISARVECLHQERQAVKHGGWGHRVGKSIIIRDKCFCGCRKPEVKET